ncbi:recombinase zinc beta ribbon domain-containing protein [Sphingomonas sp. MA1305]|uniref:recombinase zinc beta ribbon domain-containing protein n=1 Tax=Sphingomonas sp. MA1305 TaxID=2479204 RepID=UPI003FA72BCD
MVAALESAPERIAGVRRVPGKRLLSGLIRCGECGGTFTVVGAERWGRSTARSSGTCDNSRTISTLRLKSRVLGAPRERLLQPDFVAAFVEEYRREREAQRAATAKAASRCSKIMARVGTDRHDGGRRGRLRGDEGAARGGARGACRDRP